ncbi:Beta-barrel assembly machine subunit BamC [Bacillus oleivorans]|uniref:Beta-barrel assembly machine subunit BamC n=1 Tax=Bacillus oleivorans TaxID=1448271 RepID=A0A285CJY2_9BACI|nr:hypothetical protein [Bacillus oleivorans]SNX67830.1 Beta-barrel assembly machine subunit BamC [Bacillus oleivorans]
MRKWISATIIALVLLAACSQEEERQIAETEEHQTSEGATQESNLAYLIQSEELTIDHIHGIGYNLENELMVATHHGLKLNRDGVWYETTKNLHDYMGFQVTEDGFLVSGHPEEGSSLKNPLGLVKASDYGENLETIEFSGESDFHFLGASFSDQDLYVINEQPNSELDQGFYHSPDGGQSFDQPEMAGFDADSFGMIAVHPSNGDIVAMATREGVYGSTDGGDTFSKWAEGMITALAFSEKQLVYASVSNDSTISLHSYSLESKEKAAIVIPHLDYDNPITFIAVSPTDSNQIAITTYDLDILQTKNFGANWEPLIQDGKM